MLATLQFLSPLTAAVAGLMLVAVGLGFGLLRWLGGPAPAVSRRWGLIALRAAAVLTLILILLNPSDVSESPGPIDRPDIFFLLDTSQSMAVGDQETRFDHAVRLMREAELATQDDPHAQVKLFRFGHRLSAVEDASSLHPAFAAMAAEGSGGARRGEEQSQTATGSTISAGTLHAAEVAAPSKVLELKTHPVAPTEADTQLLTALRQISSRFGRRPPAGIVLFSDGRARDEGGHEQIARQFAKLKVPVHVVPVGDTARGGDVAIVACVAPPRARRFAEVEMQVFLRSYGYEGRRCELTLTTSSDDGGEPERQLAAPLPVTLHDGFQTVQLSFRTEAKTRNLRVDVTTQPDEISTANNSFDSEIQIDRTKIRVLYIEGSSQSLQAIQRGDKYELRGPYSDLQRALQEDEDIECVVLSAGKVRNRLTRVNDTLGANSNRDFPETIAELSAFDAVILSDIAAAAFTDQQLEWIESWIGRRGGGLLMVGGQHSFAAGRWDDTPIAEMLPVVMQDENDWIPGTQVAVRPEAAAATHPLWSIVSDEKLNRSLIFSFPSFFGANRWSSIKPDLTRLVAVSDLAVAEAPASSAPTAAKVRGPSLFQSLQKRLVGSKPKAASQAAGDANPASVQGTPGKESASKVETLESAVSNQPAIVVGRYGRGRTMAMAVPITSPWANEFLTKWGGGDSQYYAKFWRNAIYWLTENSSIGRRRLVVTADKKFYRPGETISLNAAAFDESANQTGAYRITSMIEPQISLSELETDYSPLRWPDGKPRESGESGPFIAWGEEFDLPRVDAADGAPVFALEIPISEALAVGSASQSLRIELTAMDDFTQVDSTSLDIQILHDPFEQQNPFPNHELLASIAENSGGRVIDTPRELAEVLTDVPIKAGIPVIRKTPLWSTWWLWSWLLGLLTADWIYRRIVGLA